MISDFIKAMIKLCSRWCQMGKHDDIHLVVFVLWGLFLLGILHFMPILKPLSWKGIHFCTTWDGARFHLLNQHQITSFDPQFHNEKQKQKLLGPRILNC